MRALLLGVLVSIAVSAATPAITYTRSFPGSDPDYIYVSIDRSGALEYKESPTDNQSLKVQLREAESGPLFDLAEKLDYFKLPLESGLKVANTGKKTFRYVNETGSATEATFNYSTNETAKALLAKFEHIAATEHAYLELDRTVHYDKLGVNDALADIEELWLNKQLSGPEQFIPLLTRISTHESFMHLVRERAARLKEEFTAPRSESASEEKPQ